MLRDRNRSFQNSCEIDTGLSDCQDCHKMTVTLLRSHLNKLGPKIIHYMDYKNLFRSEVIIENRNLQNYNDLDSSLARCKYVLNKTVSLKQKHVRANNNPFVYKTILQAIIKQTKLKIY